MKPDKFFSELRENFDNTLYSGLIVEDEVKYDEIIDDLDPDDHEALVMRLYFLAIDPEKKIDYFINQYDEGKYLYMMNVQEGLWLFVLSASKSFAKLHFFIRFLLSESTLEVAKDEKMSETDKQLLQNDEKILSAKRIQDFVLPGMEKVLKRFEKHHLWYQPKDVVGGDFYWAKIDKDITWIVIGDCTGHSVEGALASVSVISILNQVYEPKGKPHWLIKNLHRSLNDMQEQDSDDGYGIGCEMIVMKFDHSKNILEYSGTGMILYEMKKDSVEVHKTKKAALDPDSVVKYLRTRALSLNKGQGLFTHSDGFSDQFNEEGRKLKWKKILRNLQDKMTVNDQTTREFFQQFKGDAEQTDDIITFYVKP